MRCFVLGFLISSFAVGQVSSLRSGDDKYKQEGLLYEQIVTHYVFSNDGSSTRETTARVRVQSDAGLKETGLLIFRYQRDLDSPSFLVKVHKPDGRVIETPAEGALEMPADITRQAPLYSDVYEKHITVKGLAIGDTLEYSLRIQEKPIIPGEFWLTYNFSNDDIVLDEELQVSVPAGMEVKVKSASVQPSVSTKDSLKTYLWQASNLKHKTEKEKKALLRAADRKLPDIQLSSFRSWEQIGNWYDGLQTDRVVVTPEIQAKATELTTKLNRQVDKAEALYRYVSTAFRYTAIDFGIGRYQPHSADDVFTNGYGDCKDKHTLLAALLKAVGIPAQAALVSYSRAFDPDVPSPAQFSHLITRVTLENHDVVWLDTTQEVAPFDFLASGLRDHYTLVVGQGNPQLLKTPENGSRIDTESTTVTGKLDDKGTLTADFEVESTGNPELILRSAFRQVPEARWQELVQQISYAGGYAGTVSDVKLKSSPEDTSSSFVFTYKYKRDDFGDWANRRILTACTPAPLPDAGDKDDDPAPVWLGAPIRVECESSIELPPGYEPSLPQNKDAYKPFAEFHLRYDVEKHILKSDRSLDLKVSEIPRDQVVAYRDFRKQVAESEEYITLMRPGDTGRVGTVANVDPAGAPRIDFFNVRGSSDEANRAYDEGMRLMSQQQIGAAQDKFQQASKIDPKHPRVWAALAMTYLMSGNTDRAVEFFRRQVKEVPSIEAYKIAGMTLMQVRRFDEAVDMWREALKLYPEDRDVPANLGTALNTQGKYEEAAIILETAVAKNPDNSHLLWQLANAYKANGKKDEAAATLRKTLDLDSTPGNWNDVAYQLADMERNLPESRRLANQAVADVQEKASRISLDTLSLPDLATIRSLAAYWDTIGWVAYREGSLDTAERYIHAAWELSQSGEVADHLGQICQAQKKRALAEKYFAMALAAPQSFKPADKHLQALVPDATTRGLTINKARDELSKARTFHVTRVGSVTGSGEFFVVFKSDGSVEDAKIIDGNNGLSSMVAPLKRVHFAPTLPLNSDAKLVRRGIMMCTPPAPTCDFVLLTVDTVRNLF
jgi:tetratricopeptide (TPR) repeat protein/transglutaminase-like putative cysteine protease